MDPYLQFTCGPLLRYDNVNSHGVWCGAALIVSAYFSLFLAGPLAGTNNPSSGERIRSCGRWVDI